MTEDDRIRDARSLVNSIQASNPALAPAAIIVQGVIDAYEERLRVNVGLLTENTELKRRLRDLEESPRS